MNENEVILLPTATIAEVSQLTITSQLIAENGHIRCRIAPESFVPTSESILYPAPDEYVIESLDDNGETVSVLLGRFI